MARTAACALALAGAAAGLDFQLQYTSKAAGLCAPPAQKGPCRVERSGSGELLRMVRAGATATTTTTTTTTTVARSYDGHDWEGLLPSPLEVACDSQGCVFEWDTSMYTYTLEKVAVTPPSGTRHATAKLFAQATFGARMQDLEAFDARGGGDATAAGAWFDAQVGAPVVLMREYYRRRANPRLVDAMNGTAYEPCDVGARWHRYAFTQEEVKAVLKVEGSGTLTLIVKGNALTEVAAADFDVPAGTYEVCKVAEWVGGDVEIAAPGCATNKKTVPNPALGFANPVGAGRTVIDALAAGLGLKALAGVRGAGDVHITQAVTTGGCAAYTAGDFLFLNADAGLLRYDRRLKLLAGDVASPLTVGYTDVSPGDENYCPAAPVTFLNEGGCVLGSPCRRGGVACGSRGEAANDPNLGNRYVFSPPTEQRSTEESMEELDFKYSIFVSGPQSPFHNIVLTEADSQLRYRVVWALYQILPVAQSLGRESEHEIWSQYLDIFATHAFGNYLDVLKEVAWSPMMGAYLSHYGNQAFAAEGTFPDQNFAREIMQLFTIGLYELHPDGSRVVDPLTGQPKPTYGVRDIVTLSRAWTGFWGNDKRGNIERRSTSNYVDPMEVRPDDRDAFPKTDLHGGYIGDGYPLCQDLPARHHLAEGALYTYVGNVSFEGAEVDAYAVPYESLVPAGTGALKSTGPVECVSWTKCGTPTSDHAPRWKVPLEAIAEVKAGADTAEVYLHGDNGGVLRVAKVVNFAYGGDELHIAPFFEITAAVDFDQWASDFDKTFPAGTSFDVANSAVKNQPPDVPTQYTAAPAGALYDALCRKQGGACQFAPVVRLPSSLNCAAGDTVCEEMEDVTTVKIVDGGVAHYYTYTKPPCTKFALYDGKVTSWKSSKWHAIDKRFQCSDPRVPVAGGVCCHATVSGASGRVAVSYRPPQCHVFGEKMRYDTAAARCGAQGLVMCADVVAPDPIDRTTACNNKQFSWVDKACRHEVRIDGAGMVFVYAQEGLVPVDQPDERFNNASTNMNSFYVVWEGEHPDAASPPDGCAVEAGSDGVLQCSVRIVTDALFSSPPSRADAEAKLRIGAFDPSLYPPGSYACAAGVDCSAGDVIVHTKGGSVDAATIIGLKQPSWRGGGYKYFTNKVETVVIGSGASTFRFRNPPVFMPLVGESVYPWDDAVTAAPKFAATHAAAHETDAVLDHLFYHPNTAPFVTRLLIQRLVTSNPSPRYARTAAEAFTKGIHEGRGSGRYGCMTATLSAILLDREARSSTLDADPGHGSTREPFLKVMQFLRSQEYATSHGQDVFLSNMADDVGQEMFLTPSVFGFYLPTYAPGGPIGDAGLVSPEATLSTAPRMFALLDGLGDLVRRGMCSDSFGRGKAWCWKGVDWADGGLTFDPTGGAAGFPDAAMRSLIVDQLDLLLTDGRLAPASKAAILAGMPQWQAPYAEDLAACPPRFHLEERCDCDAAACSRGDICRADDGSGSWVPPSGCVKVGGTVSAAEAADPTAPCCSKPDARRAVGNATDTALLLFLLAPEFHTSNLRGGGAVDRTIEPEAPPNGTVGYKAVVAVTQSGGADSFNHLVPGDAGACTAPLSYEQYQSVRGVVALGKEKLLKITPQHGHAQPCSEFYVTHNFSNVHKMWEDGDVAFFGNVGNLVEPAAKATLKTAQLPSQLFAHNVQQIHMQTMHPQAASPKGVLGRMADMFTSVGRTNVYSMDGLKKIADAATLDATVLDRRSGAPSFGAGTDFPEAFAKLVGRTSTSHFAETFQAVLQRSAGVSERLRVLLKAQATGAVVYPDHHVGQQFDVVAKIVKLRDEQGKRLSDRDVFVVDMYGYDTHDRAYEEGSAQIDAALKCFKEDLTAEGVWKDTVVVTLSDFGRTITSNGKGTDHAWGGNYFAVGGSIRDQTMLSPYVPSLEDGHEQAWGHGIFVPAWGYEVYWAPIVDWFGVPKDRWYNVLPNLPHFPPICRAHLFDKEDGTPHIGEVVCDMPAVTPGPPTPPPTPAPTPPALQPLGAFAPTCPSVAYLEAGVGGMKALTYTLGKVGAADAVLFEMRLEDGAWGGVGFRSASAGASMMKGLDIIAVDTADGVVHDYDEAQYAAAPFESSFTQTALRSHTRDGTDHVVAFYRLFENGVDFTLRAGVDLNIAAAAGAGTLSPWGMHSHYAQRDHTFTVCAASPRPDAPGADVPNTAVPSTGIPGTVAPGSPPGATARPSTSPHTTTTGEPTTAAPPGDPASKAPGNETTREPADPNQLGAAENGGGGGVATWLVVVLAFVGGLLCVGVAAALVARSRRQTVSFGEAMSTSGNLMSPSAATPLPLQPSQPDVPLRPTTVAADDESHAPTPVYTPPTAELPKAPHLPLLPLRPASTAGSNVLTML